MGDIYFERRRDQEAIDIFLRAEKVDPTHIESLYYIGQIHQYSGNKVKALQFFEQVIDSNPPP